jgi:hypothetical protein
MTARIWSQNGGMSLTHGRRLLNSRTLAIVPVTGARQHLSWPELNPGMTVAKGSQERPPRCQ